jgi:hypothetical protein
MKIIAVVLSLLGSETSAWPAAVWTALRQRSGLMI